ncbi:MAG: hypothetical protein COB02_00675 [Candidatus Cloacimonadota bacterium]|nr:MAG: hypothetical protein COB02_00675 [Candidatus Cloacimonadota bacterium]
MEEPLETLDTIPETQDKLISLIAWLIIACLLFYLALFTFESFFKANQFNKVDEPFDVSSSEMTFDSSQEVVITEPFFTSETDNEDSFLINIEEDSLVNQVSPISQDTNTMVEIINETAISEKVSSIFENSLDLIEKERVSEVIAISSDVFQLRLSETFSSREDAFAKMKEMDLGDLDLKFDLILLDNVYRVHFGTPIDQVDLSKLESYLSLRNTKVKFSILTNGDISDIENKIQLEKSKDVASLPSVENFRARAAMIQFTIQIGSFLNESNAKQLRDKMFKKGFNSDVEAQQKGAKVLYKVLVGNYATRREALEAATELSESDRLPVYVRTIN